LSIENFEDETPSKKYENYHIVCSRYSKDVGFLDEINISKTIVSKNEVPNKANETTSFLHFIINNYHNLPENIIFIHDENESWHHRGKITEDIYKWIDEYESNGRKYHNFNSEEYNDHANIYKDNPAFRDYWDSTLKSTLGEYETAKFGNAKCCAQFIVSRDKIIEKPKSFYENVYNWFVEKTSGEGNGKKDDLYSGFNTGRYAEYTWKHIFY
jgi:hypothetical protein